MTPIQFALMEVNSIIPREILELSFKPKQIFQYSHNQYNPYSIDDRIRTEVIDARIRPRINLIGSKEIVIPLEGLQQRKEDNNVGWTMHIPKDRTGGRRITEVSYVIMGYTGLAAMSTGTYGANAMIQGQSTDMYHQATKEMMENARPLNLTGTANVDLIAENTIYCEDYFTFGSLYLRCKIDSDEEFSWIQGDSVAYFAQLVVLATKAYIYRNVDISLDKGRIEAGQDIGRFREIIDGYSDAQEMYNEFIDEKWKRIQRMSDTTKRRAMLRLRSLPL